jgi:hypothetical protein
MLGDVVGQKTLGYGDVCVMFDRGEVSCAKILKRKKIFKIRFSDPSYFAITRSPI